MKLQATVSLKKYPRKLHYEEVQHDCAIGQSLFEYIGELYIRYPPRVTEYFECFNLPAPSRLQTGVTWRRRKMAPRTLSGLSSRMQAPQFGQ